MFSRPVILIILLGVSLLMACEKTLPLKLSASSTDLVVEGTIEKGQQPYVYLTNSLGFFNKIDLSSLSYVHHAVIQVQDVNTGSNITLKEYSIDTLVGGQHYSFTLYAPDMADTSAMNFKGQLDHTYKLQISSNGKQYVSYTRIPNGNGLDSIWTEKVKNNDSLRTLRAIYVDPDTFGNAIRVQTLVHKVHKTGDPEVYQTAFNQVYNDDIVNGARLPISIDIGYDKGKTYVMPSMANAKNKSYPIIRPLMLYYNVKDEAKVKPFIDFCLSAQGQKIVEQVGYVPLK